MIPQSVTYSADGTCATFGFDFPVFEPTDLDVLLNGTVQSSGFTLLGASSPDGGAVRFASAPTSGTAITLRRTGKVQVSGSDAPSFLEAKVLAGAHIAVTKTSDSAGEHLTIAIDIDPAAFATAAQGAKADSALQPSIKDTDGALAANSDGLIPSQKAVKTYVDGKIAAAQADISVDERNILTLGLMNLANGGYAAQTLFGGFCDAFNADTIGANSANGTFDGTGKLYTNAGGDVLISGSTGTNMGSYTEYGGLAAAWDGTLSKIQSACAYDVGLPADIGKDYGSSPRIPTKIVVTSSSNYGFSSGTNGYSVRCMGSNTAYGSGGTQLGTTQTPGADPNGGVLTFTFSNTTAYRYVWVEFWNDATANGYIAQVQIYETVGPSNMTLVSNALSPAPASAPATVKALVLWKDVSGSASLNTDFTLEATRDDSTWTAGTLSDSGFTIAGFKVLSTDVDVSGQPSGNTVKYRLKTFNNKAQQVKGVALLAK